MFLHKKCKSNVFLDLTDNLKITANFSVTDEGISISVADIESVENPEIIFMCKECDSEVSLDEIEVNCDECWNKFNIEDLFVLRNSSGIFCKDCLDKLNIPEKNRKLLKESMSSFYNI
jgi:uncharacterized protein YlaI